MGFREIIKFLVVDADKDNVKHLKGALQYLGSEVKACKYKEQALSLLLENKRGFDIVLVDVDIPYEMGFKFVEIVSSKMNIPIIVMCSASDHAIIAAGMNFGSSQVVVKPVRLDDIRRFWQFALEHRRQNLSGIGNSARNSEGLHCQENGSNQGMIERGRHQNRFVWTKDLIALFAKVVHSLGGKDMAAPKKIMELMNVPNLTRENVASHLQKYRLHSDPNYQSRKRKSKVSQAMPLNGTDEQAPIIAHPNRCVISFAAPEFPPNAQNFSTWQQLSQIEGTSRSYRGMNSDSTQVNGMTGYGNPQGAYFKEPKIAQFPDMPERDTWQQLYSCPNVQPYVPEPPVESVMIQGMAVPEVFGDRPGPSLHAQSLLELQVPSDVIRSQETSTSPDLELESFLGMDLCDPNFPIFDVYPPQYMSMIYGGLSNGLHDNNYPVGQLEMGMAVPEVFGDRPWPSLPAQSSLASQVSSDGIRSDKTPTSLDLDPELESFLAMDLSDPNFPFFDVHPPQDMSMIYGGLSNGLLDNNYQVEQSEMGNVDMFQLNDRITNDPATDSLIVDNPVAMHYPPNISAKGGIVDHSNTPRQQHVRFQQEHIRGTPQDQPSSSSGQTTSEASMFGQAARNDYY